MNKLWRMASAYDWHPGSSADTGSESGAGTVDQADRRRAPIDRTHQADYFSCNLTHRHPPAFEHPLPKYPPPISRHSQTLLAHSLALSARPLELIFLARRKAGVVGESWRILMPIRASLENACGFVQWLALRGTQVTDEGLKALAGLKELRNLSLGSAKALQSAELFDDSGNKSR